MSHLHMHALCTVTCVRPCAQYQNYILDLYIVPPSPSDDVLEHCKILSVKPFHESVDAVGCCRAASSSYTLILRHPLYSGPDHSRDSPLFRRQVLFDWKDSADRSTLENGAILPYGVDQYIELEDKQVRDEHWKNG